MKRRAVLLAALLCLLTAFSAAAEGRLCVVSEDRALLLSENGEVVVPAGEYQDICSLIDGERCAYGVQTDDGLRYALGDAQGNLLTEAVYEALAAAQDCILFRQNGRCGAMTTDGKVQIEAIYTQLVSCGGGKFLATQTDPCDEEPDEVLRIVPGLEPERTGVRTELELTAPVSDRMPFYSSDVGRYGYLDGDGKVFLSPHLSYAGAFVGKVARASRDGKLGLLSADGSWVLEPEFDFLEMGDGVVVVMKDRTECAAYDLQTGALRVRVTGEYLEAAPLGKYMTVADSEHMRVYGTDGAMILETDRSAFLSAGVDGQLILRDGDWGTRCVSLFDPEKGMAERMDMSLLPLDSNRYLFMTMNAAAYNSAILGERRYSCDYDSMRFGIMDGSGNEILPAEALEITRLRENRYLLKLENGLRVIDENADVLWEEIQEE